MRGVEVGEKKAKAVSRQCDTKIGEAIRSAEAAADAYGLPQTVFKDGESGGWWHTNSLAGRLGQAQCERTVLPARYFS